MGQPESVYYLRHEAFSLTVLLLPVNIGCLSYDYFGKGYKVKITIAGVSKYYLFDLGCVVLLSCVALSKYILALSLSPLFW